MNGLPERRVAPDGNLIVHAGTGGSEHINDLGPVAWIADEVIHTATYFHHDKLVMVGLPWVSYHLTRDQGELVTLVRPDGSLLVYRLEPGKRDIQRSILRMRWPD